MVKSIAVGEAPELMFLSKFKPLGFSHKCPRCGAIKTYYSGKYQCWACGVCGLLFAPQFAEAAQRPCLSPSTTCDFCTNPAVTIGPTRLGYDAPMCSTHLRLYGTR